MKSSALHNVRPARALILCGALFALACPAAAQVRPAEGQPGALETKVKVGDLNLNRIAGADVVLARLNRAARAVCGEAPLPMELAKAHRYRACVTAAEDDAVARLGAPLVTARYNGQPAAELAAR